jgi:transposase-like protein
MIPNIPEAVEEERKLCHNRSLDALLVTVRLEGSVINKAIHLALGVTMATKKALLGLWITQNESSKFWLLVLTNLQRGVKDILIACN